MAEIVINTKNLDKSFGSGETEIHALRDVNLEIMRGDFAAIVGPSGSGKTTLLNILCGLDTVSSGEIQVSGRSLQSMSGSELAQFRREHIGLVFQAYNLIPVLTVLENIEYVMLLQNVPSAERKDRVRKFLTEVGLEGKENRFPAELSGGQQQRVAIARAMVSHPDIILADEPTANLDSETGAQLLDMMRKFNEELNMTFVFSTHDPQIMERAKRMVTLTDGQIVSDELK
ncbi:MAG: ABC transporter ATP-binding protein [SAR324 cluster bacterium]|jgi:putative ABC transport system ATP-binding protein|nr:ABC transporter ATP-binding protein [SAR324 cluster bacterium]MDP6487543.1 ABC transporter ATP-binding protein [SAR324 cluster bacterium]MDP7440089.1 ABC transporter ATP-binding protein [SAR324 cluster bacterium]